MDFTSLEGTVDREIGQTLPSGVIEGKAKEFM
jgi:hypothetical protein